MRIARGLSGKSLPVHPVRLPDELFTSWFYRTAHSNGLKAQGLATHLYGRGSNFWTRDQDRMADPEVLARFGEVTGKGYEEAYSSTLKPYEGVLYEKHNPNGYSKWILSLGHYHRVWRRPGLQFCPLCLAEDEIPYFRRKWRLAFYTVCDKHGTMMHDRCPQCGAPASFFRQELGHRFVVSITNPRACHQCGQDLSRAPAYGPSAPDAQTLISLWSFSTFLEMGWWFTEKYTHHYSHAWLDVVHHLVSWFSSAFGRRALSRIQRETAWPHNSQLPRGIFENRPVVDRHFLLMNALWVLQDWPRRFLHIFESERITQSRIRLEAKLPFWFEQVLFEHLDRSTYEYSEEEIRQVAQYLARSGKAVSILGMSRLLGTQDAKRLAPYKAGSH